MVRLIACFIFFLSIQTSYAEDVSGSFRCEVDDVMVLEMEGRCDASVFWFQGLD